MLYSQALVKHHFRSHWGHGQVAGVGGSSQDCVLLCAHSKPARSAKSIGFPELTKNGRNNLKLLFEMCASGGKRSSGSVQLSLLRSGSLPGGWTTHLWPRGGGCPSCPPSQGVHGGCFGLNQNQRCSERHGPDDHKVSGET